MTQPVKQLPMMMLSTSESQKLLMNKPDRTFIRRVVKALTTPPYVLCIKGLIGAPSNGRQSEIICLLNHLKRLTDPCFSGSVSFTAVEVQKSGMSTSGGVTRYSRSDKELTLHTDSSYKSNPDNLMGFQCIENDSEGGISYFMSVSDIIAALNEDEIQTLREPIFPYSQHSMGPILSGPKDDPIIGYYRGQLDLNNTGTIIPPKGLEVMDKLDGLLSDMGNLYEHRMEAGEMILLNNHKALHGRSHLVEGSHRLLYRGRITADITALKNACKPWPFSLFTTKKSTPLKKDAGFLSNFDKAMLAINKGDIELGRDFLSAYIDENPKDANAYFWISTLHRKLGDYTACHSALEKACALQPITKSNRENNQFVFTDKTILSARSYNESKYVLKQKNGHSYCEINQGHFSMSSLLNPNLAPKHGLNLYKQDDWEALQEQVQIDTPDLVINTIACAERMQTSLKRLDGLIGQIQPPRGVINDPKKVMETRRELNMQRLSHINGLVFPKTIRLQSDGKSVDDLLSEIQNAGLQYPIILRPTVTHTGKYVCFSKTRTEAEQFFESHDYYGDYYAIQFIETANAEGIYNKNRIFCIDGKWYPVAGLHHDAWNIHSGDRYSIMDKRPDLQEWEQNFLSDLPAFMGEKGMKTLAEIHKVIDLDFYGIDCTKLANGDILIFECNPSMRHNFDHAGKFPYTAKTLKVISKAFSDMIADRLSDE